MGLWIEQPGNLYKAKEEGNTKDGTRGTDPGWALSNEDSGQTIGEQQKNMLGIGRLNL